MAAKRSRIEVDPDYQDVTEQQNKRQRVLEQDAKVATRLKIEDIIKKEFAGEIHSREMEIDLIDQRLNQTRLIMDRLRACIVANYYGSAGQTKPWQGKTSDPEQVPSIHPAVKQHLGKTPKGYSTLTDTADIKTEPGVETPVLENVCSTLLSSSYLSKEEELEGVKDVAMDTSDSVAASSRSIRAQVKKRIIVGNVSKYIPVDRREENDQPTHKWMVYVRGPKDEPHIDHFVKKVWFLLHPSYRPNDLVEVSNPPFHLTRRGWGEFPVRVQLHFKDPRNKRLDIIHQLKLDRTYTGLQTLGAETVVDVELERDFIPERTKQCKSGIKKETSKQVSVSTLNGETGENVDVKQEGLDINFTIKEHTTPKKGNTADQKLPQGEITLSQNKPQGNVDNGTGVARLSNKENCFMKSANGSSGSPVLQKPVGGPSQIKCINNVKGLPIMNPTNTLSTSLVVGNLLVNSLDGKAPVSTLPQAGVITPQASPSRTGSTLLLSGTSGVQVVLGGFGSITGVQKPTETKTQTGKSLLKKISDAKSVNTTVKTTSSSVSSPSLIQTGNRLAGTQSPSSFVLQGLGSLSGTAAPCVAESAAVKPAGRTATPGVSTAPTNIIVASSASGTKTPAFHIVTSSQTDSTGPPAQISAPAAKLGGASTNESLSVNPINLPTPPQTLYVRCKDNSGNIFLVPHHLLKQVSTTATKTSTHNTSSTAMPIISNASPGLPTGETRVTSLPQKSLLPHTSQLEKAEHKSSSLSGISTVSSKSNSLPSSLLIKVEAQSSAQVTQQNASNQSESQKLRLVTGSSQGPQGVMCAFDLKKPSTVFHVKSDVVDPTQTSSKVVKDLFAEPKRDHKYSTPNASPEKKDGTSFSQIANKPSKLQPKLSDIASNAETRTAKEQISEICTTKVLSQGQQGQGSISTSGHLKVTPHGLKIISKGTVEGYQGKSPPNTPQKMTTLLQGQGKALTSGQGSQSLISTSNSAGTLLQTTVVPSYGTGNKKERTTETSKVETVTKRVETQSLLTGKTMLTLNNFSKSTHSLSTASKVKNVLPNSDSKAMVTLLNGQSIESGIGGKTSLLSGETSRVISTVTPCQTTSSSQRPLMTLTSSMDQEVKNMINSGSGKTSDFIQGSQCKTMMATIGSQKLLIHVPELNPVRDESHQATVTDTSPWLDGKVKNKYFISDDKSSSQQKKIINAKKKKCYETAPFKPAEVLPISVTGFHDLLSLVKAAVRRHPVICENVDRSLHPYCARSLDEWLSWNVGKRRASEWQRASFARKFLLKNLNGETSFKGESLWTTKQIMVWCRHHVYSPHFLEKTLHPSPVELSADSSMLGKRYTSATDSDVILSHIQDMNAAISANVSDEKDVDIISVEPPKVKVKTEVIKELVYCDPVVLPPSRQARFVQDLSTKIGVRFQPSEIDQEIHGSVAEDMVYSAMKTFMSDILRETYSMKVNMGRYADSVGVGDVYRTLGRMTETDFLTNHHLGVPANNHLSSTTKR
ncbi:YEATS domain-containing protein 2-like [Pecten maximus]|uniref:YEATS domain-containing protein 2-like n=1 Tax=Pecten maximus TaxID=6579 RepID=UPI001458599F|nr:YEATS domain-containing protein 2-like [Pecten maximus]XP_033733105.1 YEATS domain-containing protein 2-like [Pecten maximus]XP_033733106.1 YEATS domain-containing protein 2-like [Pecten maximus]